MKRSLTIIAFSALLITACRKNGNETPSDGYTYYQVKFNTPNSDWRDTAIVIRTNIADLIQKAEAQLALPVGERQIVFGNLESGDGGFNKNASHNFKWHYRETDWSFVDVTAEIYDGKPFTDLDSDTAYWLGSMKRFGAWSSYLAKKLPGKP